MNKFAKTVFAGIFMAILASCSSGAQNAPKTAFSLYPVGGKQAYLNGVNVAWNQFARDMGCQYEPAWFEDMFTKFEANGVNSARFWLHIDGTCSPTYDSAGLPSGVPATFYADFDDMLARAKKHNVAIMPVLWSFDLGKNSSGHNDLYTNSAKLQAYIDKILIPMVKRYEGHPELFAWEIINEPEWSVKESNSCDANNTACITLTQMQKFVGLQVDAINNNTTTPVTVGSASWKWNADKNGEANWWSDSALTTASGKPNAKLDFYQIHYYDWMKADGYSFAPWDHTPDYWLTNIKPVLIGEMPGKESGNKWFTNDEMVNKSFTGGYIGAMPWQFTTNRGDSEGNWDEYKDELKALYDAHPADIKLNLSGTTSGTDTTAPIVSMTAAIVSGECSDTGTNYRLSATATDDVGVTKVEFFKNANSIATSLGVDTTAPYSLDLVGVFPSSNTTYSATAYDAGINARTSDPAISLPSGNCAPTISLASSSSSVTTAGSITLTATVVMKTNAAVSQVDFYDGTTLLSSDITSPYSASVALTNAGNGTKSYTAKMTYGGSNTLSSSPVNVVVNIPTITGDTAAPTVSLGSSATNVAAAGSITLTSTATDNVGVTKVEFYDGTTLLGTDTSSPYTQPVTFTASATAQTGTKSYTAKAFDAVGNNATSSAVAVTLNIPATTTADSTPPTVSLSSSSTSVTTASTITLTANATDNVGVTKVEFYDGSILLSTDSASPYTASVSLTNSNNGTKTYTAKAFDAVGNTKTSTAFAVTVNIPTSTANCKVTWGKSEWSTGAVITVTVANTGTTAINGWTLEWTFSGNQNITNYWSSVITSSGANITAKNAAWNNVIPAGGNQSFGFQMAFSGTNAAPASFKLNGFVCQ